MGQDAAACRRSWALIAHAGGTRRPRKKSPTAATVSRRFRARAALPQASRSLRATHARRTRSNSSPLMGRDLRPLGGEWLDIGRGSRRGIELAEIEIPDVGPRNTELWYDPFRLFQMVVYPRIQLGLILHPFKLLL